MTDLKYIFFFQVPFVSELMLSLGNFAFVKAGLVGPKMGVKDRTYITDEDVSLLIPAPSLCLSSARSGV